MRRNVYAYACVHSTSSQKRSASMIHYIMPIDLFWVE